MTSSADTQTGEIITTPQAELFEAWAQYCSRDIRAIPDSKGLYSALFPSYESVLICFQQRAAGLGLGVYQVARGTEGCVFVETIVTHKSGASFHTGEIAIPVSAIKGGERRPSDYAASYAWAKRISLLIGCFTPSADPDSENKPVQRVDVPLTPPTAEKPLTITETLGLITDIPKLKAARDTFVSKLGGDEVKLQKLDEVYTARLKEISPAEKS